MFWFDKELEAIRRRNNSPGRYSDLSTEEFLDMVDEYFTRKIMPDYALRAIDRPNDYRRHIIAEFKK